ncbi:MAG TPA: PKD domain-containing protein [Thermoanaerobaculia bacterium]|nr:PKD domain-containing protein [Thermoanaerobaculia bacterium]
MRFRTSFFSAFLFVFLSIAVRAAAPPCRSTSTALISAGTTGTVANGDSSGQDINADGRYVAFRSHATDVVSYQVNRPLGMNVYVRDRSDGSVRVVDDNAPNQGFNDAVQSFALSADGQKIAFGTLASNVAAGVSDTNGKTDVYVKNFSTNSFVRATVPDSSITTTQQSLHHAGGSFSTNADGRYVAFVSSGLVFSPEFYAYPEPTNVFLFHIYVRDTAANRTYLVTRGVNAQGAAAALNGRVGRPVLAANGQLLAFTTDSTNLRNYPNPTGRRDVYIAAFNGTSWDVTEKIATQSSGIDYVRMDDISISPDGRYVAYVASEPNATGELYVYDRTTSTTFRPRPGGARPAGSTASSPRLGNDTIVWQDYDINGEGYGGAFWLHIPTLVLQRVGRETSGNPACCGANGGAGEPGGVAVSADGRWTVYHSSSPRIVTPDGNGTFDTFAQRMTAVADFTFTCSSLTCSFDSSPTLSACAVSSYDWTFGDASSGTGAATAHTYASSGQRAVTLTVTDVNGAQSSVTKLVTPMPGSALSTGFVAGTPCRLWDSRLAPNDNPIASGQELILNIHGGSNNCAPSPNARAASVTVTVVAPDSAGYVDAYATGTPVSNGALTFAPATSPRPNNVIVPVANDGTIALRPMLLSGAVDLIVDLNGYFTDNAALGVTPLGFQPLTACRVYDSSLNGGAPYTQGEIRNIAVQGVCGIPTGSLAASLNVKVKSATAVGNLTLFPAGSPVPLASNLNDRAVPSAVFTNGVRVPLAANTPDLGTRMMVYGGTAHLVVDTNGYFQQNAPLQYTPLTPCRALDSRLSAQGSALESGRQRALQIRGNCGVPSDAKAAMVNVTVVSPSGTGTLTAFASGTALPVVSAISYQAGEPALGNGMIVPLSQLLANDLSLLAAMPSASDKTHVVVDVFGYFR